MASEGFRATVRTPKTPPEAYAIVVAELNPEDPEVSLLPEELTAVYDTRDGDHRIQAVIEVTEEPAGGSTVTYGVAVDFGGVIGRIGFFRRRMAALMRRGIAEDMVADLDGEWTDR